MLAAPGAGPWPQMTSTFARRASQRMMGRSPPRPLRCGSTTCSTKPAATAASKALPPRSRIAMPVCDASQWVELTIPKVPRSSGRVVNISAGLRERVGELALIERVVEAVPCEQLGMAALLDDATLIHDDDAVGVADGREPVRDDETRPALPQLRHRLLDLNLGASVDAARRLIQDQDRPIGQEGAGDRQKLLLSGGDVRGIVIENGVVALRQRPDEVVGVRRLRGGHDLLRRRSQLAVPDVVADGAREEPGVLQHHPEYAAHVVAADVARVDAIQGDAPAVDLVEAHQQVHERGFAGSRWADDRDRLPRLRVETEIRDQGLLGFVAESHVLERHMSA